MFTRIKGRLNKHLMEKNNKNSIIYYIMTELHIKILRTAGIIHEQNDKISEGNVVIILKFDQWQQIDGWEWKSASLLIYT